MLPWYYNVSVLWVVQYLEWEHGGGGVGEEGKVEWVYSKGDCFQLTGGDSRPCVQESALNAT